MPVDIIVVLILMLIVFRGAAYLVWKDRRGKKMATQQQEQERKDSHS